MQFKETQKFVKDGTYEYTLEYKAKDGSAPEVYAIGFDVVTDAKKLPFVDGLHGGEMTVNFGIRPSLAANEADAVLTAENREPSLWAADLRWMTVFAAKTLFEVGLNNLRETVSPDELSNIETEHDTVAGNVYSVTREGCSFVFDYKRINGNDAQRRQLGDKTEVRCNYMDESRLKSVLMFDPHDVTRVQTRRVDEGQTPPTLMMNLKDGSFTYETANGTTTVTPKAVYN